MRFPSLFRLPRHQDFEIKPRYYDPVKEDIERRTAKTKSRENEGGYIPDIKFERKNKSLAGLSFLPLFFALFLGALILGWLEYGNIIFNYALWGLAIIYIAYRLLRRKRR